MPAYLPSGAGHNEVPQKLNTQDLSWIQGNKYCPGPTSYAITDTSQDGIGLLGHLGTCWIMFSQLSNSTPRLFFQPFFPQPAALNVVVVTQVQGSALCLMEPHTIGLSPPIQPLQVLLQVLPTLMKTKTPFQLSVFCKFTEGALNSLAWIIYEDT